MPCKQRVVMIEVQAIKNKEDITKVGDLLAKHYSPQLKQLWSFGVNVALRISDLLSIELKDITRVDGFYRLNIKESKTGKSTSNTGVNKEKNIR